MYQGHCVTRYVRMTNLCCEAWQVCDDTISYNHSQICTRKDNPWKNKNVSWIPTFYTVMRRKSLRTQRITTTSTHSSSRNVMNTNVCSTALWNTNCDNVSHFHAKHRRFIFTTVEFHKKYKTLLTNMWNTFGEWFRCPVARWTLIIGHRMRAVRYWTTFMIYTNFPRYPAQSVFVSDYHFSINYWII